MRAVENGRLGSGRIDGLVGLILRLALDERQNRGETGCVGLPA